LHRRVKRVIKNESIAPKNALIEELSNLYWDTDEDLDYHKGIASGDWPSSVNILARNFVNAVSKITPETENLYEPLSNLSLQLKEAIVTYNQKEMLRKLES
jgi:hypothetical protein